MPTQIKITQLTDIGSANLAVTTLLPVVNMAGVPTTQKTTLGNLANVILSQSGGNYAPVATANIAYSVANAAQPNITSVGTLTNVTVSGNATVNGNITSNGTAYVGNLSTTGLASITTLAVGSSANLGAVANVRITGGTSGQVLSTDGAGNLSWVSDANGGSYGNSNVATYLASYGSNTITTTGNVSVGNIIGNGQALTGIAGANVSGFVPNANVANTALAVAAANVSGLGNIATINLTGSTSNVLYGNGVFAPVTGGGNYGDSNVVSLLSAFGSNTITTTGNVSVGNISTNGIVKIGNATITEINPIVLGFTDDIYVDGDVLSQRLKSNTGTVALNASNSTANTEWSFNVNGTLNLPQPRGNTSTSIQSIYSNSSSFVDFVSNNSANFTFGTTANNNIVLITGLNQNDNRWVFGYNGNLTLPGNTFAVNYANGAQVSIGGGSGNTGNVTFDDVTVQGVNGLNLSAGADFTANLAYLQVRSGDVASHIHFDTGNNQAYDLIVGDDQKFVQVSSTGNILMSSYDGANSYQWNMDTTGNLNLPLNGNINANGGGITQVINQDLEIVVQDEEDDGWSLLNTITDSLGNNLSRTTLDSGSFTITTDITGTNHSWGFEGNTLQVSSDSQIRSFGSNVVLQSMSSGTGGTASLQSVSNTNDPNIFTTIDATTTGANISVYNGGSNGGVGYTWQFANDGRLTFPGTPRIDTDANNFEVQAAEAISFEANTVVNIYTDTGNTTYQWQFGDDGNLTLPDTTGVIANVSITLEANDTGNITGLSLIGDSNANLYAHGNVTIVSDSSNTTATWSFVNTGDIVLPNDVVIGDDGSNGMMLSVPTVTPGTYSDWTFDQSGNLTLPGYLISTINDSLNATGTVQANAALLSKSYNVVTGSNVSPINGVILPANPIIGTTIVVAPRANTGDIKIYPQLGGTIEYGTTNDPLQTVANQPGNIITFVATSSTNWITG